jgi:hypothetical protein
MCVICFPPEMTLIEHIYYEENQMRALPELRAPGRRGRTSGSRRVSLRQTEACRRIAHSYGTVFSCEKEAPYPIIIGMTLT